MAGAKFPSLLLLDDGDVVVLPILEFHGEQCLISDWGGGEDESDADRKTAALILISSFELVGDLLLHQIVIIPNYKCTICTLI